MKGNVIKVITLIVLIVLVVITFKLTGKEGNTNNSDSELKVSSSTKTSASASANAPKNEQKEEQKQEEKKDEVVVPEENNVIKQYKLYNKYVVTNGNTEYRDVDYKYYIIRSYSEYKQYIESYIKEFKESTKYTTYNEDITDKMSTELSGDFFNDNSLVILVDMNKKKEINGTITEISINDAKELNVKIKKETQDNLSNAVTYMIPVEKGIKSVKLSHVN